MFITDTRNSPIFMQNVVVSTGQRRVTAVGRQGHAYVCLSVVNIWQSEEGRIACK